MPGRKVLTDGAGRHSAIKQRRPPSSVLLESRNLRESVLNLRIRVLLPPSPTEGAVGRQLTVGKVAEGMGVDYK